MASSSHGDDASTERVSQPFTFSRLGSGSEPVFWRTPRKPLRPMSAPPRLHAPTPRRPNLPVPGLPFKAPPPLPPHWIHPIVAPNGGRRELPIVYATSGTLLTELSIDPTHTLKDVQSGIRSATGMHVVIVSPQPSQSTVHVLALCAEQGTEVIQIYGPGWRRPNRLFHHSRPPQTGSTTFLSSPFLSLESRMSAPRRHHADVS